MGARRGVMEIFQFEFMKRAFLAGGLLSITASILGVFMVLRRESMIGHGLSHATFAGVAIGLLFGGSPMAFALVVAIIGAIFMLYLKEGQRFGGDTGIGILSSVGMALGITIATLSGDFNADLLSYFFGSILTIGPVEVWISAGLTIFTLALLFYFFQDLVYVTFDRECAMASGISVQGLELILGIITAVTVVVGMKVVGLLLVTALMVIPGALALIFAASMRMAMVLAVAMGILTVTLGLCLSFYLDLPASGSIVLLQGILLGLALFYKQVKGA